MINNSSMTLEFKVPLTTQAYNQAKYLSQKQNNTEKSRQVYLNTLAVYAVNFYCQCMEIDTNLKKSDSWNFASSLLMDVADLEVSGLGKLECRPILPESKVAYIPPEVWSDRIGYVFVKIDENEGVATLLGFAEKITSEELPLNRLQSLEDLLDCLEPKFSTNAVLDKLDRTTVRLGEWLQNLFAPDWQPVELVIASAYRGSPLSQISNYEPISISRAKVIDLGILLAQQKISLLVEVKKIKEDASVDVRLQLLPAGNYPCLPKGIELIVLDKNQAEISRAIARTADNWIQLELEDGNQGMNF
ncbi:MAG: DUF1822 family protein [Calothrix sp. SM1_7_51]|nr:DUF1822 family protein [Calothrix sp. SM1_7_51]